MLSLQLLFDGKDRLICQRPFPERSQRCSHLFINSFLGHEVDIALYTLVISSAKMSVGIILEVTNGASSEAALKTRTILNVVLSLGVQHAYGKTKLATINK